MWKVLIILIFSFIYLLSLHTLSFAENDGHYSIALKFVELTYNKEAAYQNFIRFSILSVKERYENNPKTKDYSDVIVNVIKEVLNTYFNDPNTQSKLKAIHATIYKDEFTEDELKEMILFYKTDTGQKSLKKLPIVMQKGWDKEIELSRKLLSPKYDNMMIKKIETLQTQGILPKEFK